MMNFNKRLQWCMKRGKLTVGDLHHWFNRPRSTVRTWAVHGRKPYALTQADAYARLALLEYIIREGAGIPVPGTISYHQRPDYLKGLLRNGHGAGVPPTHPAG